MENNELIEAECFFNANCSQSVFNKIIARPEYSLTLTLDMRNQSVPYLFLTSLPPYYACLLTPLSSYLLTCTFVLEFRER